MQTFGRIALLGLLLAASAAAQATKPEAAAPRRSSVGLPARIDQIVLPGSELVARPIDSREVPVVLRVVASYPHGTDFRYDLEYYGLEPGTFDLTDYLVRKDGTTADDLTELPVEIVSLLPAGQILPVNPPHQAAPRLGGYRLWLVLGTIAWLAGLAAIIFARRRAKLAQQRVAAPPPTLAQRLQPLVTAAIEGRLSPQGTAEIERLLLTYWRRRLDLEGQDPREAVATLRNHEQAGLLLRQVEAWLHSPEGAGEVDVAQLLAPYRDLPADVADEPALASGGRA